MTSATSGLNRKTAASSSVSKPTSRSGCAGTGKCFRASDKTVGSIFAAHPQVFDTLIRVFFLGVRKNAMGLSMNEVGWGRFVSDGLR
jgi:hypothetical protein